MSRTIGLHCAHEQYAPSALLLYLKHAEEAGFRTAMCSDHFHPWSERQGQSGSAWSWLGAALEGTSLTLGTVAAPGQRHHPAMLAQATATLLEMYPRRLWLAVGTGEALNEAITGEPWPSKDARHARLESCVAVMRALWRGETVSTTEGITVKSARLYTKPSPLPLLLGAALTPATARRVARWADGLITVSADFGQMRAVVDAFREGGGDNKPLYLQSVLAFAATDAQAVQAAHDQWRQSALSSDQLSDLDTPAAFDSACGGIQLAEVSAHVRASADIWQHVDWVSRDLELGFEHVYLHNVARHAQPRFIEACGTHLLPALCPELAAPGDEWNVHAVNRRASGPT